MKQTYDEELKFNTKHTFDIPVCFCKYSTLCLFDKYYICSHADAWTQHNIIMFIIGTYTFLTTNLVFADVPAQNVKTPGLNY